tara:strand:- start:1110 stop:1865 length:756 start_codon:yes stop_codon:yes gene_type:complete
MTGMKFSTVFLVVLGAVLVITLAYAEMNVLDIVKEYPPAPSRYKSLKLRDPFIPLARKKRVSAKSPLRKKTTKKLPKPKPVAKAKVVTVYKERKEPAGMPLMPMEVYKKIQDTDPEMEANLKYYEKLFTNKVELRKMTDKKYNEVVSRYRNILLRTQKIRESFSKTELQIPYNELVFVGTIFKKKQIHALVETQDHKGYGVIRGTFVGPNLGIVEDVNKKSIIIAERYRNYLGEVIEKKQKITHKMPTHRS